MDVRQTQSTPHKIVMHKIVMSDNNDDTESETSSLSDLNDYFFNDGNFNDCYLTKEETNQFMAPP